MPDNILRKVVRTYLRFRDAFYEVTVRTVVNSFSGIFQMKLFFVLGAVQTAVYIRADFISLRNIIDKGVYRQLLYKPLICDPGNCALSVTMAMPSIT